MYIEDVKTGQKLEAVIEPISAEDLKIIKSDPDFTFNWGKYKGMEVRKLRSLTDKKILGLMCIIDHTDPGTNAIQIECLEVRDENVGKKKKLDRIAGCLIAYACRESIKRGHDGHIYLYPKSNLIEHYQDKYGFFYTGPVVISRTGIMIGEERLARKLIKEYLE